MPHHRDPSRDDVPAGDAIPWNLDAEESVLGAVLTNGRVVDRLAPLLRPDHFYRDRERLIYAAALDVAATGLEPDPVVVGDELRRRGQLDTVGGVARLAELVALTVSTSNVEHYARIVRDRYRARDTLRAALELRAAALNGGLDHHPEVLERLRTLLRPATLAELPELEELELDLLLASEAPVIPWLWDGWIARGDLAIVAADPGTGKSLLTLALGTTMRHEDGGELLGARVQPGRFGYVDLENPASEVQARFLKFGLRFDDVERLHYAHNPELSLATPDGIALVEAFVRRRRLDCLVIDSLRQAAPGIDENDSGAMSAILSPLRRITSSHDCAIVVIHHAKKRQHDGAHDGLSLLRGSTAISAALDQLLFLRAKPGETDAFTLEHAKNRRGPRHESILVRLVDGTASDGYPSLALVNEGSVATTVDRVEELLAKIVDELRQEGGPLERKLLALRVGVPGSDRLFARALSTGWQRELLAKTSAGVGKPTFYAYAGIGAEHEHELAHAGVQTTIDQEVDDDE